MVLPTLWLLRAWAPFFLWSTSLRSSVICFHNYTIDLIGMNYIPSTFSISSIFLWLPPAIFPALAFRYPLSNLHLTPSGFTICQWYQYSTFLTHLRFTPPSYPSWIVIPHLHISMISLCLSNFITGKPQPKSNPTLCLLHDWNCAIELY